MWPLSFPHSLTFSHLGTFLKLKCRCRFCPTGWSFEWLPLLTDCLQIVHLVPPKLHLCQHTPRPWHWWTAFDGCTVPFLAVLTAVLYRQPSWILGIWYGSRLFIYHITPVSIWLYAVYGTACSPTHHAADIMIASPHPTSPCRDDDRRDDSQSWSGYGWNRCGLLLGSIVGTATWSQAIHHPPVLAVSNRQVPLLVPLFFLCSDQFPLQISFFWLNSWWLPDERNQCKQVWHHSPACVSIANLPLHPQWRNSIRRRQ